MSSYLFLTVVRGFFVVVSACERLGDRGFGGSEGRETKPILQGLQTPTAWGYEWGNKTAVCVCEY